jgi:serine/threonine-protein kinase
MAITGSLESEPRDETRSGAYRVTYGLPPHLTSWQLPPGWRWGPQSVWIGATRHSMELIDSLDRSLSLITAPDPAHHAWLLDEAKNLGHLHHRLIPTTYHVWNTFAQSRRGPGYLRHWIDGESLRMRVSREGADDPRTAVRLLRELGSALAFLHDRNRVHGALSPDSLWFSPLGEVWLLGWQWAMPREQIPAGLHPDSRWMLAAPEWGDAWEPTQFSDQWQLAAVVVTSLTGDSPPAHDIPPVKLVRPEAPDAVARVLDRALAEQPERRYPSVTAMMRDLERAAGARSTVFTSGAFEAVRPLPADADHRLRQALGDDYEMLAKLGSGSYGDVWRVRDLALEREVALKILHARIANDPQAVMHFRREARLAAQLSHPSIVPIYDWDSRGGSAWFTMELMEYGSLADLVRRSGPRPLGEVAPAIAALIDGLAAAHSVGILHRDLKPENILIDRWRRWRIGDFGLASREGLDRTGSSGTPAFAAPEQLLNETQGPAVDLFSMAGIALFALTGRQPFGDGEPRVLLARQIAGDPDLSGVPDPIARWLARGLAAEPEKRWRDASQMRTEWLAAAAEVLGEGTRAGWLRGLFG